MMAAYSYTNEASRRNTSSDRNISLNSSGIYIFKICNESHLQMPIEWNVLATLGTFMTVISLGNLHSDIHVYVHSSAR
jgi:hypothetical protein